MSNIVGDIKNFPLADLLTMLESQHTTGTLKIEFPKTQRRGGTLYLVRGQVVDAEISGGIKGEDAAFELLDTEVGQFQVADAIKPHPTRSIDRGTTDLLMEAARVADSRKRLRTVFPELRVVPFPVLPWDEMFKGVKVYDEDRVRSKFFDGYCDFREIMAVHKQKEIDLLQTAAILYEAERLVLIEPRVQVRAQVLKSGFMNKKTEIELSKAHLQRWTAMSPYAGGVSRVKVLVLGGPHLMPVSFVTGMPEDVIAIPKSRMEQMGVSPGDPVGVRPAK